MHLQDHMFVIITTSQHILPSGWFRAFACQAFGATKGIYTAFPGPVPRSTTLLSFLGITFVPIFTDNDDAGGDKAEGRWNWNWGFHRPCDHDHQLSTKRRSLDRGVIKPVVAEQLQSVVHASPEQTDDKDETFTSQDTTQLHVHDPVSVPEQSLTITRPQRKTRDLSHIPVVQPDPETESEPENAPEPVSTPRHRKRKASIQREPNTTPLTPPRQTGRDSHHSYSSTSGTTDAEERKLRRTKTTPLPRAPSPPSDLLSSPPLSPTQSSQRRRSRRVLPTPPHSGHRQYTREALPYSHLDTNSNLEYESIGFVPLQPDIDARSLPPRRNTMYHSSHGKSRSAAPRAHSSVSGKSSWGKSQAHPFDDELGSPTPAPRLSRTPTIDSSHYRPGAVSPSSFWQQRDRALSPPPLPLETTWTSNTTPTSYRTATSYFQAELGSPSLGYPAVPPLPPPPLQPLPMSEYGMYEDDGQMLSPNSNNSVFQIEEIDEMMIMDDGARYYRVKWRDTFETKRGVKEAMEGNSKYKVEKMGESTHDEKGRKVYRVKWEKSWELEDEVKSDIAFLRYWDDRGGYLY